MPLAIRYKTLLDIVALSFNYFEMQNDYQKLNF